MTATKQTELLPCPFCKREAQQTLSSGLVSCAHDECPAFLLAVTAEHWNTRAQSAEPVQGEAVAYGDTDQLAALNKESSASCAVWNRPGRNRTALMTVAQHNRMMAAAKPDAELVDILKRVVDYYAEGEGELKCIAQDCRAKLAELQK
jgi:hypothetical protein